MTKRHLHKRVKQYDHLIIILIGRSCICQLRVKYFYFGIWYRKSRSLNWRWVQRGGSEIIGRVWIVSIDSCCFHRFTATWRPQWRSRCCLVFQPLCPRAGTCSRSVTQTSTTWQRSTRPCWWNSTLHGNGMVSFSIASSWADRLYYDVDNDVFNPSIHPSFLPSFLPSTLPSLHPCILSSCFLSVGLLQWRQR